MKHTKQSFPELKSKPDWNRTWVIRIILAFAFSLLFLAFCAVPILFYIDGYFSITVAVLFFALYYSTLTAVLVYLFRHLRKIKHASGQYIVVDREGIHYHLLDGAVESILYKDLERSPIGQVFDVYTRKYLSSPVYFTVVLDGRAFSVDFRKTDVFYGYYTGNWRELMTHFLGGLRLFRPDLRISPSVYSQFFIDKETHSIDRKGKWATYILAFVLVVLFIIAIRYFL